MSQATWNSQLDDLQTSQRSKYQEFILELYAIYKRWQLNPPNKDQIASNGDASGLTALDGKEMVAEAMRTIGTRQSNVNGTPSDRTQQSPNISNNKDSPAAPSTSPPSLTGPSDAGEPTPQSPPETAPDASAANIPQEPVVTEEPPPPPPPKKEDIELEQMVKSIMEMGFDADQAKGALFIHNRNMVRMQSI